MPLLKELTLAATTWFSTTDDLVINNPVYQVYQKPTKYEVKTYLLNIFYTSLKSEVKSQRRF